MLVRNIKLGTVAAATTIAFAGLLTFSNGTTYAQSGLGPNNIEQSSAIAQTASPDGRGHGNRGNRGNSWLTSEEKLALTAEALGMTVEELTAAKEAGQSMEEILEAQGLTAEEFQAAKQAAMIAAVNQAVADGELTQEEADALIERIENGGKGHGNRGHGNKGKSNWLTGEEKQALKADVLGMSVEDLAAAKEAGQSLSEIAEAQGMTLEEFKADLDAALIVVVDQAVADGELTQEQADRIIEKIERDRDDNSDDNDGDEGDDTAETDTDGEVQALSILSFASSVTEVAGTTQTVKVFMPIVMR